MEAFFFLCAMFVTLLLIYWSAAVDGDPKRENWLTRLFAYAPGREPPPLKGPVANVSKPPPGRRRSMPRR